MNVEQKLNEIVRNLGDGRRVAVALAIVAEGQLHTAVEVHDFPTADIDRVAEEFVKLLADCKQCSCPPENTAS